MPDSAQIQIRVVYDARDKSRVPAVTTKTIPAVGAMRLRFLAYGSLIVAAALYYGSWWVADPFIYRTLIWKAPLPIDANPQQVSNLFGMGEIEAPPALPEGAAVTLPSSERAIRWTSRTAFGVIAGTSYGWLALSTFAACTLALASGAAFGRLRASLRTFAPLLLVLFLILLGISVWYVRGHYGMKYRPEHLKIGIGGLTILAWVLGVMLWRRLRGATRLAAYAIILSSLGTVAAIILGVQAGAIDTNYSAPQTLAIVFAAQSLWAWILLFLSTRLRSA